MKSNWFLVLALIGFGWGCATESDENTTHISGQFETVDSANTSSDISDIELSIIREDTANVDTLFNAVVNSSGTFSGDVIFPEKRQYPLVISQHGEEIGQIGVILADQDTVEITGQWPNLEESIEISSREHDAMTQVQRLNRNFNRILQVSRSGQLSGDSLRQQLNNWTDIYWEVYENNTGTIGAQLAARQSIQIAQGLDNQKMMERIRLVQDNDELIDLGITLGKNYLANSHGLESALAYLDTLSDLTDTRDRAMEIDMERIKLLYDSARVDAAQEQLDTFQESYPEDEKEWVESMSYDLSYLSPGEAIPNFQFTENGKQIGRDSLLGSPYILEITRLSNQLYQEQFDRTVVIHSIYKNYGLQVVTLPLDESQITVNAFFEERVKPWPVADAQAFDREELLEDFNIQRIPTRFLIDRKGNIVRKYVGNEYDDIIEGIQTVTEKEQEPAS